MKRKLKIIFILFLIFIFLIGLFAVQQVYTINKYDQLIKNTIKNDQVVNNKTSSIIEIVEDANEKDIPEDKLKEKEDSPCEKPDRDYYDMTLLNIGQDISLPDLTYVPDDLVELGKDLATRSNICLKKEARDAFLELNKKAREDKIIIKVTSGFRSYEYQQNLLKNAILNGNKNASKSIAKAGHSEHQLGVAVDLTGSSINYNSAVNSFDQTIEDKWLKENAYLYGFVQSYPKGKEETTGYRYEPWHYRYIGIENAKYIKEHDLTITEFLK